jgi:diguanylate cyclase (GGDEF)-like protein
MRKPSTLYKGLLVAVLMVSVISVGLVDYVTGAELAFSIFYLFPIGIAAWYVGWRAGIFISIESAFSWYAADVLAKTEPYSYPLIPAWNAGVRLITFLVITILIHEIRVILERESLHARIDYLTKAANARYFYEVVQAQISLLQRNKRPFSIVYLDMDNLKQLNDAFGHPTGDIALQETVSVLKRALRPSDVVARLGGDEFAALLLEADAHAAEIVSARIQSALRQKPGKQYRVSYSIGVITCLSVPKTVDEIMEKADNLMYEAKRSGKDTIKSASYGATDQSAGQTDPPRYIPASP